MSNVVIHDPPASQTGSDCIGRRGQSVQECQGLGKCDTDIDNVPLAIPILQFNSSAECEDFVVPVYRRHGWCNGHVGIQMTFQLVSDKLVADGAVASKSTFHFVDSQAPLA